MVVADSRSPRDGAHVKIIGHYNPLTDPATLVVKEDEAIYWLQKGAKPSDTAAKLLTRLGVMEKAGLEPFIYKGPDVPPGKKGKDGEEPAAAATATAEPAAEAPAEEPAAEEPAAEAPAEEPAAEEPAAEAPAEEPAAEEPAAEEPAAEEPAAEAPAEEPAPETTAEESADQPATASASDGDDAAKEAEDKTAPTE